jgi:hypothetical protein
MLLTLGVFLGGLALVYGLGGGGGSTRVSERQYRFALNNSRQRARVVSSLRLGHLTPQDDRVMLTLQNDCTTAHLFAYLSTGWDHGPVDAAAVILGTPLVSDTGVESTLIRHDAGSALVMDPLGTRGVLVRKAGPRDFDALVIDFESARGCSDAQRRDGAREFRHLFDTFRVLHGKNSAA